MDWTQLLATAITVLLSSGIIQFLITRKDNKKEKEENSEMKKLREEFQAGLDARGEEGKQRFEQHEENIRSLAKEHEADFMVLRDVIEQLKDNDARITETIEKMSAKQDIMAESLIGHAHDRIMNMTDKISARGSITNTEKATIKSMYGPYTRLGGNGVVQESVEYVRTLPTISDEEARVEDARIRNKLSKVI